MSRVIEVPNPTQAIPAIYGGSALYGCNAKGILISWEIHYWPLSISYESHV